MTTNTATFAVDGMTCGGCVRSVTGAISQVAGVRKVDVSLVGKSATVEFDATVAPAAIVAAIEGAGFDVRAV
jgi:copper chaperone